MKRNEELITGSISYEPRGLSWLVYCQLDTTKVIWEETLS